jgi:hypothetical protein
MLEIAGGILLAVLILNGLVFLGPVFIVVSAILSWFFMIGIGGGIVWFLYTYLDLFSASLVLATVATAIAGFGYWMRTLCHRPLGKRDDPSSIGALRSDAARSAVTVLFPSTASPCRSP